jgi:hypothetical protein
MDPINPWLDPVEVRRLAERLMTPSREPAAPLADAGFGEGFVGYAAAPISPPAATPPLPPQVVSAPAVPAAPPANTTLLPAESPTTARGPFLDRISRFRDWMRHNFSATGLFILDREGAVIFDESHHGRLHFLARSLALASRRPGASAGNVHVKIGAGATLEVIPVETAYGSLVLGAVVPEALDPPAVIAVMEALSQVASPPGEDLKSPI